MDSLDFVKVAGGAVVGVAPWIIKYLWARSGIRKQDAGIRRQEQKDDDDRQARRSAELRTDLTGVIEGWQRMHDERGEELKTLKSEMGKMRAAHMISATRAAECEARDIERQVQMGQMKAAYESEIASLRHRVETLERFSGDGQTGER